MLAMDTTKELFTQTESTPSSMINLKALNAPHPWSDATMTTSLDKERYEVACQRQDIIDEYEKKSRELLDYLNNMEAKFKYQQREYEQREAILQHENKVLKDELNHGSKVAKRILLAKFRKYQVESQEIESALNMLKDETRQHEWNYQMEHKRAEVSTFQHQSTIYNYETIELAIKTLSFYYNIVCFNQWKGLGPTVVED